MPFPEHAEPRPPVPVAVDIDLTRPAGPWRGFGSTIFSFQEPELVERPGHVTGEPPSEAIRRTLLEMVHGEAGLTRGRVFPFRYERMLPGAGLTEPAKAWTLAVVERRGIDRVLDYLLPARDLGLSSLLGSVGAGGLPSHLLEANGRTLRADGYREYVARVLAVLTHWRREHGIELDAWTLFNEPNFPVRQPTALSPEGHARLTTLLGRALADAGLPTRVAVADDWTVRHRTLDVARAVLADREAREHVLAVAYHGYEGYDFLDQDWRDFDAERQARDELRRLCRAHGVETWMTEISNYRPSPSDWHDVLFRMCQIHDDIVHGGVTAWDFMLGLWQGHWRCNARGGPQGLAEFYYEPDGSVRRAQLTGVATAIGHWSRVVRPGWRPVPAASSNADVRATAFLSPTADACACVLIQDAPADAALTLRVGGGAPADEPATGFRSNSIDRWGEIAPIPPANGAWPLALPSRTAATVLLKLATR